MPIYICPHCGNDVSKAARRNLLEVTSYMPYQLAVPCERCNIVTTYRLAYSMVCTYAEPIKDESQKSNH